MKRPNVQFSESDEELADIFFEARRWRWLRAELRTMGIGLEQNGSTAARMNQIVDNIFEEFERQKDERFPSRQPLVPEMHAVMMELFARDEPTAAEIEQWRGEEQGWFGLADVYRLEEKLGAHPLTARALEQFNAWLKRQNVGKLDLYSCAVVGCVWRKNLRGPTGVSSHKAFMQFCLKSGGIVPGDKPIHHLRVSKACELLEVVGFMRKTKAADHQAGLCAEYELLNEPEWK